MMNFFGFECSDPAVALSEALCILNEDENKDNEGAKETEDMEDESINIKYLNKE